MGDNIHPDAKEIVDLINSGVASVICANLNGCDTMMKQGDDLHVHGKYVYCSKECLLEDTGENKN